MTLSQENKNGHSKSDTRSTHRKGCDRLAEQLKRWGFHVDSDNSGRGFDMKTSLSSNDRQSRSRPVKVRAASKTSFSIWRKHEKLLDVIFAYVWHVRDGQLPENYVLTYSETYRVAQAMNWTKTDSWLRQGWYTNNEPGKRLCEILKPYQATAERWRELMQSGS